MTGNLNVARVRYLQGPRGKSAYEIAVTNGFVGTEAQWAASLISRPMNAPRLAVMGDSLAWAAGQHEYTPDLMRGATAPHAWLEMLYGAFIPTTNESVSGSATDTWLAQAQACVAVDPDVVVIMSSGVNSVKSEGVITVAQTKAHLTAILDLFLANDVHVIMGTVTPSNLITGAEIDALFQINDWLVNTVAHRRGVTVVDIYAQVADPAAAGIAWQSSFTTDQTHPSTLGAKVIGKLLYDAFVRVMPPGPNRMPASTFDPLELMPTPLPIGTAGTSGLPTLWFMVGGTGTQSRIPRTDGVAGDMVRWEQTAGTCTIGQDAFVGFAPGDRVLARVELKLLDTAGLTGDPFVYVEARNSGVPITSLSRFLGQVAPYPTSPELLTVFLNEFTLPALTNTVRVAVRTVGACTVEFGRFSLRKVA